MKGHYRIGDLNFTIEATLKELAHCRQIIREIRKAEYRLQQASDSDNVYLIYDQDLEGERGTFDKMRLRAYNDDHSFTLDIGSTDNNPLGIYVGSDQNVQVYDYDQGAVVAEITPDGTRIDAGSQSRRQGAREEQGAGRGEAPSGQTQREQRQQGGPSELQVVGADQELVAEGEIKEQDGEGGTAIGEERGKVLAATAQRSGLTKQDVQSVCEQLSVSRLRDVPFAEIKTAYRAMQQFLNAPDDLPV